MDLRKKLTIATAALILAIPSLGWPHDRDRKDKPYYDMEWVREQKRIELEEKQLEELRRIREEERERRYEEKRRDFRR